jgi:hypothetical protein
MLAGPNAAEARVRRRGPPPRPGGGARWSTSPKKAGYESILNKHVLPRSVRGGLPLYNQAPDADGNVPREFVGNQTTLRQLILRKLGPVEAIMSDLGTNGFDLRSPLGGTPVMGRLGTRLRRREPAVRLRGTAGPPNGLGRG